MKKRLKFLLPLLLAAGLLLAGAAFMRSGAGQDAPVEKLVIHRQAGGAQVFAVEIANTPVSLEIGLMFRERLAPDHGMLFEMGEPQMTRFWMKNTLIPLDMLFIAADGRILKIHENAAPGSLEGISSEQPVTGVLELNGGRARALGIAVGDRVEHPYFTPKNK